VAKAAGRPACAAAAPRVAPAEQTTFDPGHPLAAITCAVLTPHIGGATYDAEINHTTMIVADIERLLKGERPLRCANPEVLG
jgi:phosphoglycerate dehydrogenase-like enzyme